MDDTHDRHTQERKTELAMHLAGSYPRVRPQNGDVLWTCQGIPDYVVPGIVVVDDVLYCSGGRQNRTIAVKAGGRGDVTETHKLWEVTVGANVTTPLFTTATYFGHMTRGWRSANAEDSSTLFRERYESRDRVYASIALGDGRLYAQLRDGTCWLWQQIRNTPFLLRINLGMETNNLTRHPHSTRAASSSVQPKLCIVSANRRGSIFSWFSGKKTMYRLVPVAISFYRPSCLQPSSQTSFSSSLMMSAGMTTDAVSMTTRTPNIDALAAMDVDLTTPT